MSKELFVGPFPKALTREEKEEFLKYFGALSVTHVSLKNKQVHAVAMFNSQKDCEYALRKIHQIEIFGMRISAKYYDSSKQHISLSSEISDLRNSSSEQVLNDASASLRDALLNYEAEISAISANFGIYNPLSQKLRYSYSPPTPSVLCNIAHALVAVPKFYTQVLHLMNKMNLPCPFGPLTREPILCQEAKKMTGVFGVLSQRNETTDNQKLNSESPREQEILSQTSSESELESDNDGKPSLNITTTQPPKRLRRQAKRINKRPKLETLKQTLIGAKENVPKVVKESTTPIQDVFEKPNVPLKKKLSVNVQSTTVELDRLDTPEVADSQEENIVEGFGKIYPQPREASKEESKPSSLFISLEELSQNRVEECDWPIVPIFKNYNAGNPSSRLYIKNLAKTVTESDLHSIFGRYINQAIDEETSKFNIRLMKEGRMKGQAFVTFSSTEAAALAIKEVNGFILKDKPMVIVFGRFKTNE